MTRKRDQISGAIVVEYREVAGWHVFTSEQVRGLYVAHKDQQLAFESVAPTIEALLAENEHVTVQVIPQAPFERFMANLKEQLSNFPLVPGKQQFSVTSVA